MTDSGLVGSNTRSPQLLRGESEPLRTRRASVRMPVDGSESQVIDVLRSVTRTRDRLMPGRSVAGLASHGRLQRRVTPRRGAETLAQPA